MLKAGLCEESQTKKISFLANYLIERSPVSENIKQNICEESLAAP